MGVLVELSCCRFLRYFLLCHYFSSYGGLGPGKDASVSRDNPHAKRTISVLSIMTRLQGVQFPSFPPFRLGFELIEMFQNRGKRVELGLLPRREGKRGLALNYSISGGYIPFFPNRTEPGDSLASP